MAKRPLEAQRLGFEKHLEEACTSGRFVAGRLIPPTRELARQFGVSRYIAQSAVKKLEARGLLHTIARVGTFAGQRSPLSPTEPFLLLFSEAFGSGADKPTKEVLDLRCGFENRIAELGGAVLSLSADQLLQARREGKLIQVAGVLDLALQDGRPFWETNYPTSMTPRVRFSNRQDVGGYDTISFDDEGGGYAATRHLLERGYNQIAFFAAHPANETPEDLEWSAARQQGWQWAINEFGADGNVFRLEREKPIQLFTPEEHAQAATLAWQSATKFLKTPEAAETTAWVCANDDLATGLIAALESTELVLSHWPAIVGFDNQSVSDVQQILTSLRLPWSELGATAANLLWERFQNPHLKANRHREVKMQLVPRYSSHSEWARDIKVLDFLAVASLLSTL